MLMLTVTGLRKLMPNETYYKTYDDPRYAHTLDIDEDMDEDDDD